MARFRWGLNSKKAKQEESKKSVNFYSREDYDLFRLTGRKLLSDEEILRDVKKLLKHQKSKINDARYRALYIAAARGRFKTFAHILEDIGVDDLTDWDAFLFKLTDHFDPTGRGPQTLSVGEKILQAILWLLDYYSRRDKFDVYFRDRDGQSLMHYIAKDGYIDVFEFLVKEKRFNPLRRDRVGRTAWDLAYLKSSPHRIGIPGQAHSRDRVSSDLIRTYVLQAPERRGFGDLDSEEYSKIICAVPLHEEDEPSSEIRFSPKDFFAFQNPFFWLQKKHESTLISIKGDSETIWIQLDENNDSLFTVTYTSSQKVCSMKGYDDKTVSRIFNFHAETFLEQDQGESHFKFRQPLYKTRRVIGNLQSNSIEIMSIVLPFFDSGIPEGGERAAHLHSTNSARTSEMSVHVQRTLDESYYLGLDSEQLERRNSNKILEDDKFKPMSNNKLLVSQLWLWKINNVIITAFPREEKYKSSNLLDHTLSLLRDIESDARKALTSDQLAAWIFSECIHRLDYPCMADLEEPILYFLGKVVAVTLDDVELYLRPKGGMQNIHIEEEKKYIEQISAARSKISMIKNIVLRQEEVWKTFNEEFLRTIIWGGEDRDTEALSKVQDLTLSRPSDDFKLFKHRIQRIEQDAKRVEERILVQLDLKVKHASLRESHNSLLLSMAVIGFTIITIIFAPLSFLTSLLALPIDHFQDQQSTSKTFTTHYIARWLGVGEGLTWALTIILILGALRFIHWMEKMPSQFLRPAIKKGLKQTLSPFYRNETITKSDKEDRGAKSNVQTMKPGESNGFAATPTLLSPKESKSRYIWFNKRPKADAVDVEQPSQQLSSAQ
ncbi:hypothetical protein N431DRAFT_442814 [Stipitochalara longipes BDJ]|nr:hypothetical protein N431DRAFT_442814 [Stipitochalara longipes BDJ]